MTTIEVDLGPVLVTTRESGSCAGMQVVCIHHRALPELQAEGTTCEEAARTLLRHQQEEWGAIADAYHRERLGRIITDLRTFLDRLD
jgi:hypothetical protein